MKTDIETYLNSLSEDISELSICNMGIRLLPDLTRFKNLKKLYCYNNHLPSLPTLPPKLEELGCCGNNLTVLPTLPQYLTTLDCSSNKLTVLPTLPPKLEELGCCGNKLTVLPTLPQNLIRLFCSDNNLTSLPTTLPQNLTTLHCYGNKLIMLPTSPENIIYGIKYINNPIYEIVNNNYSLVQTRQNIQILNNFRHLYYCLKFKKQLRKWLWEKVREPIIKKLYNPLYLIENLGDEDDLDTVLKNWE